MPEKGRLRPALAAAIWLAIVLLVAFYGIQLGYRGLRFATTLAAFALLLSVQAGFCTNASPLSCGRRPSAAAACWTAQLLDSIEENYGCTSYARLSTGTDGWGFPSAIPSSGHGVPTASERPA